MITFVDMDGEEESTACGESQHGDGAEEFREGLKSLGEFVESCDANAKEANAFGAKVTLSRLISKNAYFAMMYFSNQVGF